MVSPLETSKEPSSPYAILTNPAGIGCAPTCRVLDAGQGQPLEAKLLVDYWVELGIIGYEIGYLEAHERAKTQCNARLCEAYR